MCHRHGDGNDGGTGSLQRCVARDGTWKGNKDLIESWISTRGCIRVISCGEETKAGNPQLVPSISVSFNRAATTDATRPIYVGDAKDDIAE